MSEKRWNPLLGEWVLTATERMDRPQMPKDWCPFCPGSGQVPADYDVHSYPNDFPSMRTPPPVPDVAGDGFHRVEPSVGACEVLLYSPDHNVSFADLPDGQLEKVAGLWRRRFGAFAARPEIRYVYVFENCGPEVGVTIPHPHGQIYAFGFLPPRAELRLKNAADHRRETGRGLFDDILERELADGRILFDRDGVVAYVPFAARWPFEVHVRLKHPAGTYLNLTDGEMLAWSRALRRVSRMYNCLYDRPFPYILGQYNAPVNTAVPGASDWRLHAEFYPPYRSQVKLKYLAGCEAGMGTFINDSRPEEKAGELRRALDKAGPDA